VYRLKIRTRLNPGIVEKRDERAVVDTNIGVYIDAYNALCREDNKCFVPRVIRDELDALGFKEELPNAEVVDVRRRIGYNVEKNIDSAMREVCAVEYPRLSPEDKKLLYLAIYERAKNERAAVLSLDKPLLSCAVKFGLDTIYDVEVPLADRMAGERFIEWLRGYIG